MALDDLKLTFRDEFNSLSPDTGTTATDANFWNTSMYNGTVRSLSGNGELQWYVDADYKGSASTPLGVNPFEVNNGVLSIKARMASTQVRNSLWGYAYTSGVLTSAGEFSQQYGYFEVRAQVPEGQGLWPAFWLLSDDGTWPPELDVMEVIGSETNYVHQTTHTGAGVNQGQATWSNEKLSAGFHTYGMDWTASTITYYLDGKATFTMATPADLHTPMYMLLNLAVGGNWPGDPTDNMDWSTANYNIDYVRVYQHTGITGSGGVLGPNGGSGGSTLPPSSDFSVALSNAFDMKAAPRFVTSEAKGQSRTYTAAEIGLSNVPSNATVTVAYDGNMGVSVTNNGAWNDVKNAQIASASVRGITIGNFVAVGIDIGDQSGVINVTDAKRGTITAGAGNDSITVTGKSDNNEYNAVTISTGNGVNSVAFSGAANTGLNVIGGIGEDEVTVSGGAAASINTGVGKDKIIIRSTGPVSATGGTGSDIFDLAAGSRVTITDFKLGEDILNLSAIDPGAINVRTSANSTLIEVNGALIATLTGVTLTRSQLNIPQAPVVSAPPAPPAPSAPAELTLSNEADISGATTSRFIAPSISAGSTATYTAAQMSVVGMDSGVTVTNARDASNNMTVTNNGMWSGIRNAALKSMTIRGMTVKNFVGVNIDIADQSGIIDVTGAKQGNITAGAGNDSIKVAAYSDGTSQNVMKIATGNGVNRVEFSGASNTQMDITGGIGEDEIIISGAARGTINAGVGTDKITIGSTGRITVTGGLGNDVYTLARDANATITDFAAGSDRIELSGVGSGTVRVKTVNGSTLVDVDDKTVATLAGVSLTAAQIGLTTSSNPPLVPNVPSDVTLSNGLDVSGATTTKFSAAATGINTTTTYTAAQMALVSVNAATTVTVGYNTAQDITVVNNGAWDDIKNASLQSTSIRGMTVKNFSGVNVEAADQSVILNIEDMKRGKITAGSGNDYINVVGKSDAASDNLMSIMTGNGVNAVIFTGAAGNHAKIVGGIGEDEITVSGQGTVSVEAGIGTDIINVRSTGDVTISGGSGSDIFSFIAGAHASITDFRAGEDRIRLSGVTSSDVHVRTSGNSTYIDLNGSTAVILVGVALPQSALNMAYV